MIATLTTDKEVTFISLGTICYLLIVKLKKEKKNRNISIK